MILNSGLDAACTQTAAPFGGSAPNHTVPTFCSFIRYAAFGTGSTDPSVTDTNLDAQVGARSDNRGGFSNTEATGLDAGNNTMWSEQTFTRVFAITGNVNATEWGLAAQASGNLSVRDLFRADPNDPNSSPITLTLEDGDQLQLIVTLRVEAAWEYTPKSFTITGTAGNDTNGLHTGNATVSSGNASNDASVTDTLAIAWPGGAAATNRDAVVAFPLDQSGITKSQNLNASGNVSVSASADGYNPGSFYRDWVATFTTAQANFAHYAWLYGVISSTGGASGHRGLRFLLTNPAKLTKTASHRLTLTTRKTIARL